MNERLKIGDLILVPKDESFLSKMISWVTRSDYVHIACFAGDGQLIEAGWKGVCLIPQNTYGDNVKVIRHKTAKTYQLKHAVAYMKSSLGAKYDYFGIVGILLNFLGFQRGKNILDDKKRYWCSELVADGYIYANIGINVDKRTFKVSPADFDRSPFFREVKR